MARRDTYTMRDIARLAGVSVSTVSAVVNNKPVVSLKLRAKVQQAIEAVGFHPNQGARSLRVRAANASSSPAAHSPNARPPAGTTMTETATTTPALSVNPISTPVMDLRLSPPPATKVIAHRAPAVSSVSHAELLGARAVVVGRGCSSPPGEDASPAGGSALVTAAVLTCRGASEDGLPRCHHRPQRCTPPGKPRVPAGDRAGSSAPTTA